MRFIVLLGIVSLFSDATYEGARSLTGQYLQILGASAAVVGFIGGFSEILGNGVRLFAGYAIDKTKKHWVFMFAGYALNLFSVPLLALVSSWKVAAFLVFLERFGKGIRTPARDAFISYASLQTGRGWAFGLHEALDQIGAVVGPFIVTAVFYLNGAYKEAFLILIIPATAAMLTLLFTKQLYPCPMEMEVINKPHIEDKKLPSIFWLYMIFICLALFGVIPFQLSAYHFKATATISDSSIPLLFAFAMIVDAIFALISGKLYDRYKMYVLILMPIFALPLTFLILSKSKVLIIAGMFFWGITVAIEESIMRAYIAEIISVEKRAFSYGIFNAVAGIAKFIRSTIMGFLYYKGLTNVIILGAIIAELLALLLILFILSRSSTNQSLTSS